ncbi:MAG TPA: tetratricopeptide repeat protein [Candidatus Limnocylindrales bacterium]|jgi:tetratricopeptide (TPR) repeat protein|nr:tetratricopeptide repeat protein [Candidatus Limnocylindrales bacterium]
MSPRQASRSFALCLACLIVIAAIASASPALDQQQPTAPVLVPLATGTPQELEKQGDQLRAQKRYLDSIDYYDAALAKQPSALLWNKKGIALLFLTRSKDAQKCFQQGLKLDKNSAEALNNLGFVEQMQKNYGKAIKYYNKALVARPNSATFHYNLGAAYFGKRDFSKATQEYQAAYQLDADIFQRVSKMGIMAQSSSPEDRAAFSFMVAKMYAQAGDFEHSLEYLRKAMEQGYKGIGKVYTDSEFASLRTDPRFADLMAQKPPSLQ